MSSTTVSRGGFGAWLLDPKRRGALLVAPALIILFVMNIFPLLWSFGLSFFNYRASSQRVPRFQGLENYQDVLTDDTRETLQLLRSRFPTSIDGELELPKENNCSADDHSIA